MGSKMGGCHRSERGIFMKTPEEKRHLNTVTHRRYRQTDAGREAVKRASDAYRKRLRARQVAEKLAEPKPGDAQADIAPVDEPI